MSNTQEKSVCCGAEACFGKPTGLALKEILYCSNCREPFIPQEKEGWDVNDRNAPPGCFLSNIDGERRYVLPKEKEDDSDLWNKSMVEYDSPKAVSTESFEEENENKRKHKEYAEKMYEMGLVNFISSEREKVRQEVIEKIKLWKKNNYFTDPTTNEEVADEILKNLSNK